MSKKLTVRELQEIMLDNNISIALTLDDIGRLAIGIDIGNIEEFFILPEIGYDSISIAICDEWTKHDLELFLLELDRLVKRIKDVIQEKSLIDEDWAKSEHTQWKNLYKIKTDNGKKNFWNICINVIKNFLKKRTIFNGYGS